MDDSLSPRLDDSPAPAEGTPLYVHVPFCASKCRYCDFPSFAGSALPVERYLDALLRELAGRAPRRPATIFVGGGTPTWLPERDLGRLLEAIAEATGFDRRTTEYTVEANPESATPAKLALLRAAGANRLSLGVQAFRESRLRFFDRPHTVEDAFAAYAAAREAGFENVNLDLIFGAPGQTLAEWKEDLARAIALRPDHLALYDLVYEEGTTFRRWRDRGWLVPLDEDTCAALYDETLRATESAGYEPYEISNFALPGKRCRHNLGYWRNDRYVGVGCGAASFDGEVRARNHDRLAPYLASVEAGRTPWRERERLDPRERLGETVFLGLRLRDGVSRADLLARTGLDLEGVHGALLARLRREGLVEYDGERLVLTRRGRFLADLVASEFVGAAATA